MNRKKVAILGTPGYVRNPRSFDDDTLLKILGENSGNLIFQYAVSQFVNARKINVSMAETPYSDRDAVKDIDAMFFPAANHLRLGADWTGLNGYLASVRKPLVVLGLGAQSPSLDGEAVTIKALRDDPHVSRLAAILRERAALITVRGPYSQKVCEALGLQDVLVLGCPSALINPDPALGRMLEAKLDAARAAPADAEIAVTAAAAFEIDDEPHKKELERRLYSWLSQAPGGVYVQQSGGVASMRAADGHVASLEPGARKSIARIVAPDTDPDEFWGHMIRSARFYLSAPTWIADMQRVDLTIGTRLHGNMASIAAGTPGIIIAHDSRTGELGRTMHLPSLNYDAAMAAKTLGQALAHVQFDGKAFDAWRGTVAKKITAALGKIGIPVSPGLAGLAKDA